MKICCHFLCFLLLKDLQKLRSIFLIIPLQKVRICFVCLVILQTGYVQILNCYVLTDVGRQKENNVHLILKSLDYSVITEPFTSPMFLQIEITHKAVSVKIDSFMMQSLTFQ